MNLRSIFLALLAFLVGWNVTGHSHTAESKTPNYEVVGSMENVSTTGWMLTIKTLRGEKVYDDEIPLPANALWHWPEEDVYTLDAEIASRLVPRIRMNLGLYTDRRSLRFLAVELTPVPSGPTLRFEKKTAQNFFEYRGPCEHWLTRALKTIARK